jgi:hypothetical protein
VKKGLEREKREGSFTTEEGGVMRRTFILAAIVLLLAPAVTADAEEEVLGTVTALRGGVQIGQGGAWSPAGLGQELQDGQMIRTESEAGADILFGEDITASVGPETEIEVSDLLLKARLEKMRSKVSLPTDTRKVEMQVTPTTGVRGTEQTEEKAEELKREHYWNESVKQAE